MLLDDPYLQNLQFFLKLEWGVYLGQADAAQQALPNLQTRHGIPMVIHAGLQKNLKNVEKHQACEQNCNVSVKHTV